MSPVATSAPEEKRSSPAPRKARSFALPPEREVTPELARSRPPEQARPPAPPVPAQGPVSARIAPTAPPAVIHPAEVMTMQAAYGNAAMARAAASGEVALPKPEGAPLSGKGPMLPTILPLAAAPAAAPAAKPAPEPAEEPIKTPPTAEAVEKHEPAKTPGAAAVAAQPAGAPGEAYAVEGAKAGRGAAEAKPKAPGLDAAGAPLELSRGKVTAGVGAGRGAEAHAKEGTEKPAHPAPRQAIAPVVSAIRHRAAGARKHSPPEVPVASAAAAAIVPKTEQKRTAAVQTVVNLEAAKTKQVKRDEFKSKLKEAINRFTQKPKTKSEADKVMKTGAAEASSTLRGQLGAERDAAAGPLQAAASTEVPESSQPAPPKADARLEPIGAPPAPVPAAPAVPAPLPAEQLDYSSDRAPTDQAMAESGVTKEQLQKGNEPEFSQTLSSRSAAEQHEASLEGRYRKNEAGVREKAEHAAHTEIAQGLAGLHGVRSAQIGKVIGQQLATTAKDALEHQRVTDAINGIKNKTRDDVQAILTSMETEASQTFEAGLARAEKAYEDTFEEAKGGAWTWLTTWGSDWEELIESSLDKAREVYQQEVDKAIDEVANCVDGKIEAAKQRVVEGKNQVETYVAGLDDHLRHFGEEALKSVSADFDEMGGEIDQRRDALVDKLAQQYKASYDRMSAMEEKLREENKSLWQRVYDATVGLIKKILAFKDMLLNILSKAASVVRDIISDPIGFLGNLVSGVMLGLQNFKEHLGTHLLHGLMEWLLGALAGAGLQLPDTFDLKGIVSIVLQILGLTYANFRARAVAIVGEPVVKALEQAAEVFKVVLTEGIPGLWRFIKDKLADLKSMVMDAIFGFIKERVIIAGITWIISLLNPASAFFKACKAIYDIVMFFVEHGSQIIDLVNAIIDSMAAIAKGSIGVAATYVENALAKAIPVAIAFLADLLGLGDISGTIKETIDKAQAPVNKAIDWVINLAVKAVKAVGSAIGGLFGKKDKKEEPAHEEDPEKGGKIAVGLDALRGSIAAHEKEGKLTRESADQVASEVRVQHPVFQSLSIKDAQERWIFVYTASPEQEGAEAPKAEEEGVLVVSVLDEKAPGRSTVGPLELGPPSGWGFDPTDPRRREGRGSPAVFEEKVGSAVAEATGLTLPPIPAGRTRRPVGKLPEEFQEGLLVPQAKTGAIGKRPDFVLFKASQVEVFEATLDANFEIGTSEQGPEISHKRIQLAGTVKDLAQRYPEFPIIFNIVTHRPISQELRDRLGRELRSLRQHFAKQGIENPVQIIWRS